MTTISTSPPPIPPPPPITAGLSEQTRRLIQQARASRKRIDRAASLATFNAWSAAILAALSAPFILFDAYSALAVLILAAVASVEFRGRAMLRRLDPRAPVVLACNQLALGLAVICYAASQMYAAAYATDPHLAELASISDMGRQFADIERSLSLLVFGLLIPATLLFQGGMAWFYLRTIPPIRRFLADTPEWVIDLLNAAA